MMSDESRGSVAAGKHRMYCLDRKAVSTLDSMRFSASPIDKKAFFDNAGGPPYTMRQSTFSSMYLGGARTGSGDYRLWQYDGRSEWTAR